jgi:TRAP-type C4-dicarboxylate transport system permease small subunit
MVRQVPSGSSGIASALDRVSSISNAAAELVLWVLVALMIIVTFMQVVFRYGLESSLSWSEELARYLFVWIIFIGISVATRRRQHIFVEVLVAQMPRALRIWTDLLSVVVSIIFFAVFGYVCSLLMLNAWHQYSTALDVRIAYVYAAAPIGAGLSVLHLVSGLLQRWSGNEQAARPLHAATEGLE